MPARDGYQRITLWQPATGAALSLAPYEVLFAATPVVDEETFPAADGTSLVRRRARRLEMPVIRGDKLAYLRILEDLGCPVKAVAIGFSRHEVWLEPSQLQVIDVRRGFGNFAGSLVILENRVLEAAIYQSHNLLEGIPWTGTVYSGGSLVRSEQQGYEGPAWSATSGTSVSAQGVLLGGEVSLQIEMPIGGALLRFTDPLNPIDFGASVQCISLGGTILGSFSGSASFVVPASTYLLNLTVTLANHTPQLLVERAGQVLSAEDYGMLFPLQYTPCLPTGITGGPAGPVGGDGSADASGISLTCNECFVLFEDVTLGAALDNAGDETATPGPDGYHVFTRAVRQTQGYEFNVSVAFLDGASPAAPAGAFLYAVCDLSCALVNDESVAEREIDFSIATDEITPGTYAVVITVSYEACVTETQDLTFNLIIS